MGAQFYGKTGKIFEFSAKIAGNFSNLRSVPTVRYAQSSEERDPAKKLEKTTLIRGKMRFFGPIQILPYSFYSFTLQNTIYPYNLRNLPYNFTLQFYLTITI